MLANFDDVDADHPYASDIAAVADLEIFKGTGEGFQPNELATREQIASVLVRAFDLAFVEENQVIFEDERSVHESHLDDVRVLASQEIARPDESTYFNPKNEITREDFASLLQRTFESVEKDDQSDELEALIEDIEDFAEPFKEGIEAAEEAGFKKTGGYVPEMGYHYINEDIDIYESPNALVYGYVDGELQLVGVEWISFGEDAESPVPGEPLQYNESNGNYDRHYYLVDNPDGQFAKFNPNVELPVVDEVSALDTETIEVTFTDEEAVEVELDEELEEGEETVTFEHEGLVFEDIELEEPVSVSVATNDLKTSAVAFTLSENAAQSDVSVTDADLSVDIYEA
ncbi:S-layer homology domain-containing protein [Texcoconibacillus texcoconensis]|uniref:SLH domain-containing protein n=1 Tax=Texcoconibacillus texcoconensis TaxID=1095777 RepID=A0A840QUN1_9BACI|nr:S-layer homology domain-containing protein [Texcoconibacillus texcoconensis]MBB5175050.1 hypothetical protein [Texcoconibacillus texcoconensis]